MEEKMEYVEVIYEALADGLEKLNKIAGEIEAISSTNTEGLSTDDLQQINLTKEEKEKGQKSITDDIKKAMLVAVEKMEQKVTEKEKSINSLQEEQKDIKTQLENSETSKEEKPALVAKMTENAKELSTLNDEYKNLTKQKEVIDSAAKLVEKDKILKAKEEVEKALGKEEEKDIEDVESPDVTQGVQANGQSDGVRQEGEITPQQEIRTAYVDWENDVIIYSIPPEMQAEIANMNPEEAMKFLEEGKFIVKGAVQAAEKDDVLGRYKAARFSGDGFLKSVKFAFSKSEGKILEKYIPRDGTMNEVDITDVSDFTPEEKNAIPDYVQKVMEAVNDGKRKWQNDKTGLGSIIDPQAAKRVERVLDRQQDTYNRNNTQETKKDSSTRDDGPSQ